MPYFLAPLDSPRASGVCVAKVCGSRKLIICIRFGIPRMEASCLGSFPPAPCSPPLGGSIADSAVRFTPAVKYGGRENRPSGRATRCMSGHPCRAHHKLKWARKFWGRHPAPVFDSFTIKEFVVGLRRHNPQVQCSLPCIWLKFHVPNMR